MQWNHSAINIAKLWDLGCYGNDVVVGVIDSGCYAHPDLVNNLLPGKNYTSDDTECTDDNIGHGTFVCGIIAAECNGEYIDGIAHKAKIVPLKCFDKEVETKSSMISDAIYDAIDLYGCDVINISFGIPKAKITKTLENAINYALENNCIIVTAVGNGGSKTEYYPAKYDGVIGVGAVDKNGKISNFSQRNSTVDFVAPGQGIRSVTIDGYKSNSGTSFATPHITALAAIAKGINKNITASEFTDILIDTSLHPKDEVGKEKQYDIYYGYGTVDAGKMFDKLIENEKYYFAPISEINGKRTTAIYNNSGNVLKAKEIVASYKNNILEQVSVIDLDIPHGEWRKIQCEVSNEELKVMIWSDLTGFTPIT